MGLSKKQKIYGLVLTTAVSAFGWDYLSSREKPAAAATDLLVHTTAAPQLSGAAAVPAMEAIPPSAIATRLKRIASTEQLNPANVSSAFALGPAWFPEKPALPAGVNKAESAIPIDAVKDFAHRHRLDAVMVRPRGGYAIVDGIGVFIGQNVERFRLVSVAPNSAIFVNKEEQVELKIVRAGELSVDGSVISNPPVNTDFISKGATPQ